MEERAAKPKNSAGQSTYVEKHHRTLVKESNQFSMLDYYISWKFQDSNYFR